MPAETHQMGRHLEPATVLELLFALLADATNTDATSTLASLGVDEEELVAMWDAVCEEFAERALGPEPEPGMFDVSLTPEAAASAMAQLLEKASPDVR